MRVMSKPESDSAPRSVPIVEQGVNSQSVISTPESDSVPCSVPIAEQVVNSQSDPTP